jgi:L-fucose isomerase-like protein
MAERRAREANKQRQEEIRSDTQKLFQLATELKAAVEKSNENMLSLEVVKKADEVEKLAKKVKEKMREGTATPPPPVKEPPRWGLPQNH